MKKTLLLSLFAAALVATSSSPAEAGAPVNSLDPAKAQELLVPPVPPGAPAGAPVQPQVLYLVAPGQAVAAQPEAKNAFVQLLEAIPFGVWFLIAGLIASIVFAFLRNNPKAMLVKDQIDKWADFAYFAVEDLAAKGVIPTTAAAKAAEALNQFHTGLMGQGIQPSAAGDAAAKARWAQLASMDHVQVSAQAKAMLTAAAMAQRPTAEPTDRPTQPPSGK